MSTNRRRPSGPIKVETERGSEIGSRLADELGRRIEAGKCPSCGYSTAGHHPDCRAVKRRSKDSLTDDEFAGMVDLWPLDAGMPGLTESSPAWQERLTREVLSGERLRCCGGRGPDAHHPDCGWWKSSP